MDIPNELHCEVTFHVKHDVDEIALQVKAAELDEVNGVGPEDHPTGYTFAQAFQIVWHQEPEWVRKHLIDGWTLDRAGQDGVMRDVWPERTPT